MILAGLVAACNSGTREIPGRLAPDPECLVMPGAAEVAGEPLVVALAGEVDPRNALDPTTFTEQIVFDQLYETLINVDCTGRTYAGLAERWESNDAGGHWIFHLRPNVRFADGTPLTGAAVLRSWRMNEREVGDVARLLPLAVGTGATIRAVNDSTLEIVPARPNPRLPQLLSAPRFRVMKPGPKRGAGWRTGTREFHAGTTGIVVISGTGQALELRVSDVEDERDLVDGDADVVLLREAGAVSYAGSLGEGELIPLRWDRTYVLISPGGGGGREPHVPSADADDRLLAAVRGDVRRPGPASAFWLRGPDCGIMDSTAHPDPRSARIVFRERDGVAHDLAARLVALAGRADGTDSGTGAVAFLATFQEFLSTEGLGSAGFERSLRDGTDLGYIIDLPSTVVERCGSVVRFAGRVPWFFGRKSARVFPLAMSRRYMFVRGAGVPVSRDATGGLRFLTRELR